MNYLSNLKIFFNNAFLSNKKFILIPYSYHYYIVLKLLKNKGYIKNFIYIKSNTVYKCYLLIELKYTNIINKYSFKILLFKHKLKVSIYSFRKLIKLFKFTGLFLFNTSLGILTLNQMNLFKIGGFLILYIY